MHTGTGRWKLVNILSQKYVLGTPSHAVQLYKHYAEEEPPPVRFLQLRQLLGRLDR